MSYVVLARKWRPMKFEDVVAQDHITATLKNAIKGDRIASAYLFSGPRGVGKTTTARILAKAINCDQGPSSTPCNECPACTEITSGRSLDVFEIDGASNRGIDEVRNLRENLKYAPSKGKHKIYIIDEVHMLTTEAFNALLKTLEEPPARVLFVFATTEFHKVPATILSRCQRYDFRRIPINEIIETLKEICSEEKVEIADEALFLIARKADGSLRDSQSLLDQVISFSGEKVAPEDVRELLGVIDQDFFFDCSEVVTTKNVTAGLQLVEKVFNCGYDLAEFLNGLGEHFRNILVVKATDETRLVEGMDSFEQKYKEAGQAFSEPDLLRLVGLATDAAYQIKHSANPKLILEMTLIKMIKMDHSVELDTLLSSLENLKTQASTGTQPSSAATSSALKKTSTAFPKLAGPKVSQSSQSVSIKQISNVFTEAVATKSAQPVVAGPLDQNSPTVNEASTVSLAKIKTEWSRIVDSVKEQKIHLGSFLNEGFPTGVIDGRLEISFGKQGGFHLKTVEQNHSIVERAITEVTGFRIKVHCRKDESAQFEAALNEQQASTEERPQESQEDAMLIPIVKKVIEVFDGEIVRK